MNGVPLSEETSHTAPMDKRILYLVGGPPRVGKSALAQRLLKLDQIPWLPTDVLRTVLRRVLPELDAIDQDPVDASLLSEYMYRHIEQAAEVCTEENERFLIEGFELSAFYPRRLAATLENIEIRVCFLGNRSFSTDDLAGYRGPKPQHRGASREELSEAATWIRQHSEHLYEECLDAGLIYIDVGELGFDTAMIEARRQLVGRG